MLADCVRMEVQPTSKRIRANEVVRVHVSLMPLRHGRLKCYLLAQVEGCSKPMAVKIEGSVHGLQASPLGAPGAAAHARMA